VVNATCLLTFINILAYHSYDFIAILITFVLSCIMSTEQ